MLMWSLRPLRIESTTENHWSCQGGPSAKPYCPLVDPAGAWGFEVAGVQGFGRSRHIVFGIWCIVYGTQNMLQSICWCRREALDVGISRVGVSEAWV